MNTPPATFRAFIAIVPPDDARIALGTAIQQLQKHDADAAVRWSSLEALHITLAFLGQTPHSAVAPLLTALSREMTGLEAFDVRIGSLGAFPGGRSQGGVTVIWAGVDVGKDALTRLHDGAADAARSEGLRVDSRPFRPHITLGRTRRGRRWNFDPSNAVSLPPIPFRVNELTLMESRLGRGPATYVKRGAVTLTEKGASRRIYGN